MRGSLMSDQTNRPATYAHSGVDTSSAAHGLQALVSWLSETTAFQPDLVDVTVPTGFFASVLRVSHDTRMAISTDGVGSKSIVAQKMGLYETIGWDCVAVNVNDIICVGAEPLALVDYISLEHPHEDLLSSLGKGMREASEIAGVAVVGGELSQHPDSLVGPRRGYAFDISGTCIGVLRREPITGSGICPGDVVLGIASSGIHANGLTLARQVLDVDQGGSDLFVPDLGMTVGHELLKPTRIYVREIMQLLNKGVDVRGLAHISGDGFLNLLRLDANVGYCLDELDDPPPVFNLIQSQGKIALEEMYQVFNMGIGFCAIVPKTDLERSVEAISSAGGHAKPIGRVVAGPERRVELPTVGLTGVSGRFIRQG